MEDVKEPKTLLEAVDFFKSPENCRAYLVPRRWAKGAVTCPTCSSDKVTFQPKYNRWQCNVHHVGRRQLTLKTGTIFEDSPIGLDKWLPTMWLISSNRNGVSSWELHRALGVTQKTAWLMLQRIRLAMQDDFTGCMLAGKVEVDETFIGGKARNQHKKRRIKVQKDGRNTGGKTLVLGILQRGGKVRASVVPDRTKPVMQEHVRAHVEKGSEVHSDEHAGNWRMDDEYEHKIVNHLETYVNGNIHTNGVENFWSLLKRGIVGKRLTYKDSSVRRMKGRKRSEKELDRQGRGKR